MTRDSLILAALTVFFPVVLGGQERPATEPRTFAAVQDTLANPIRMGCGENVDPVGHVLFLRDELDLASEQWERLTLLDQRTRARTLPLARRWRANREGLAELRIAYMDAVGEIEAILSSGQLARAMAPVRPTHGEEGRPGMVRCFFRSHLAIVR